MPVVCDFIQIRGDEPLNIGNTAVEVNFNTGGRHAAHTAMLIFNVKGLNSTVPVKVNNNTVGHLTPNASQTAWATQMVALQGSTLQNGQNELQLEAVGSDAFQIRDVVCFFGQAT